MMHEVDFYKMLAQADDTVLQRNRDLEMAKKDLASYEAIEDFNVPELDRLRDEISEQYLAMQYGQTLAADLSAVMCQVRLLSAFIDQRFDNETFNMLYEEWIGE